MNLLKYIYFFINLIITVFASLPSVGGSYLYGFKLNLFILFDVSLTLLKHIITKLLEKLH